MVLGPKCAPESPRNFISLPLAPINIKSQVRGGQQILACVFGIMFPLILISKSN